MNLLQKSSLSLALFFLAAFLWVASFPFNASGSAQEQGKTIELHVTTPKGAFTYHVELAVSDEQRMKGLMYRKTMAQDHGMLFDFYEMRPVMMWMKNTYLPLDMVFIADDGLIKRIARNTTPYSLDIISSGGPVQFVLEINAGEAERTGLVAGQVLSHQLFKKAE